MKKVCSLCAKHKFLQLTCVIDSAKVQQMLMKSGNTQAVCKLIPSTVKAPSWVAETMTFVSAIRSLPFTIPELLSCLPANQLKLSK